MGLDVPSQALLWKLCLSFQTPCFTTDFSLGWQPPDLHFHHTFGWPRATTCYHVSSHGVLRTPEPTLPKWNYLPFLWAPPLQATHWGFSSGDTHILSEPSVIFLLNTQKFTKACHLHPLQISSAKWKKPEARAAEYLVPFTWKFRTSPFVDTESRVADTVGRRMENWEQLPIRSEIPSEVTRGLETRQRWCLY